MKILIAGDWHGNTRHATAVIRAASAQQISTVLHVGDLGVFFPEWDVNYRTPRRQTSAVQRWSGFTGKLARAVEAAQIDFRFIDGNHDNHDFLDSLHQGSRVPMSVESLTYQPRGSRLELGSLAFGFLGGAGSIDRDWRTAGLDWWAQEQVTSDDVVALGTAPLDVLLSHDVPAGVPVASHINLPPGLEREMRISRDHLRAAVEKAQPSLVFSGHWHQRLTHELFLQADNDDPGNHSSIVHVLDMDGTPANAVVLDTEDLSVTDFIIPRDI